MRRVLAIGAAVLVAGCGGENKAETPTTTTKAHGPGEAQSPTQQANAYALEQSGGEKTGCLTGPETAANPGCVYSAAFAGCLAGRTGDPPPDWSLKDKLPPGDLRPIYDRAIKECSR